jgi:hypothetical protein
MRLVLAACVGLLLAAPAAGQSSPALKKASEARNAAMRAGNAKEWGRYTTEDFTVTGADGVVKTKQQRVSEIEGHPLTGSVPARTDDRWRQHGDTFIETWQADANGKPARYTTVWVKEGRVWKVAAVQITSIATTPP